MDMVKAIFIYFLFILCHHKHSHTDIRFIIVKFKPLYMVAIPLTCFNFHCTFDCVLLINLHRA